MVHIVDLTRRHKNVVLFVCTKKLLFLKMSLRYPDLLPDVFIIVSISDRPSGPGHISYFILGMNLRAPIRGEKDTTLFALNELKSKTHNSGPWEVLYPRAVKRSLASHRQHQISRENPWMVDSASTLFSLGKSIVLENLTPSGQTALLVGVGVGCWSLRYLWRLETLWWDAAFLVAVILLKISQECWKANRALCPGLRWQPLSGLITSQECCPREAWGALVLRAKKTAELS